MARLAPYPAPPAIPPKAAALPAAAKAGMRAARGNSPPFCVLLLLLLAPTRLRVPTRLLLGMALHACVVRDSVERNEGELAIVLLYRRVRYGRC